VVPHCPLPGHNRRKTGSGDGGMCHAHETRSQEGDGGKGQWRLLEARQVAWLM